MLKNIFAKFKRNQTKSSNIDAFKESEKKKPVTEEKQ
jgi:hypothetical protein